MPREFLPSASSFLPLVIALPLPLYCDSRLILLSVSLHSIVKFPSLNEDGEGDVYPFRVQRIRFARRGYRLPLGAL